MTRTVSLKLPFPPSDSRIKSGRGKPGQMFYTQAAKDYMTAAKAAILLQGFTPILDAPVWMTFVYHWPDRITRDVNNFSKLTVDAIVQSGVIRDDNWQCVPVMRFESGPVVGRGNGHVIVTIGEFHQ